MEALIFESHRAGSFWLPAFFLYKKKGRHDMKLKDTFVTQEMDGEQVMVEADGGFAGMVRSNATAAFIIDQLKTETTKEAILDAMCQKYDAPRAVMAEDVDMVLGNLKKIGALDA